MTNGEIIIASMAFVALDLIRKQAGQSFGRTMFAVFCASIGVLVADGLITMTNAYLAGLLGVSP